MNSEYNANCVPASQERSIDSLVREIEHLREALEFCKLNFACLAPTEEEGVPGRVQASAHGVGLRNL